MELLLSGCVVINYLSMSVKLVFVGYKSLKSYRASCLDLACADSDLCAKSVSESIGKSCVAVLLYTGRIDKLHEEGGVLVFLSHDTVSVM